MPEECLPLELPEELSDEAVAQLVECLYEFARCVENHYYGQLRRYYQPEPAPTPEVDPRQRWLWPELELEF